MPRHRKLLIVGIDGVRGDTMGTLARRRDSTVGALMRTGAWSFETLSTARAISGPAWTSVLTGVWAEKHGVLDNRFRPNNLDAFPHLFGRLAGRRTASIVHWAPLNEHLASGSDVAVAEEHPSDARVCERAARLLVRDRDLDALFVHFDEVDAWGHRAGYSSLSPFYRRAVRRADRMIGTLMAALRTRSTRGKERWLVIVVSDHGGQWLTHGRDNDANRRVPMLLCGEGVVPGPIAHAPAVVDVATTALDHLDGGSTAGRALDGTSRLHPAAPAD